MSMVIATLVFAACLFFFLALSGRRGAVDLSSRLGVGPGNGSYRGVRAEELQDPFARRVVRAVRNAFSGVLSGALPRSFDRSQEARLQRAGRPGGLSAGELSAIQIISGLLPAILLFFFLRSMLISLLVLLLGWGLPVYILNRNARRREREVEKNMPDILDLLTVSVEAGLGFDGAMAKVAEKSGSILAGEFNRLLKETRMGKSRRDALRDMALRVGSEDMTAFTGAIIQAEQMGISFSSVLRVQAEQLRKKRKQRAEEAAMKAPIKILLPMVIFIVPVIFIILLGPAVINIMRAFR